MTVTINGTTGIANDGGYTGDGVVFADTTPANTLVTTTGGNVGIGTSSPNIGGANTDNAILTLKGKASTRGGIFEMGNFGTTGNDQTLGWNRYFDGSTENASIEVARASSTSTAYIKFSTNGGSGSTERARIDSSGNLLVGTTSASDLSGVGFKIGYHSATPYVTQTIDTSSSGVGTYHLYNVNATNNGYRFYVRSNGGISNYSGNNINLSDERTKTNIELAGGYLEKVCAIPVKLFNYKDEAEGEQRTLGVIAQDVEAVAPELVNLEGFGETPEDGVPLKAIYTTDMMFALMKCIQEQQAIITALTARVTALENQP